jgi:dolichyl-phosphate-mannose-protein mannosyltransferase
MPNVLVNRAKKLTPDWMPVELATLVAFALIALGAALRIHAFASNPSLSLDEAALARNVIARSWTNLIGPLDYAQVAPPGFALAEKAAVTLLGSSEYALRLPPLLCGLLSLGLCWAAARRILAAPAPMCALFLCAVNNSLIDCSVTAKHYSFEVAAALLVVLFAIKVVDRPTTLTRTVTLGVAAATTTLFSFTAVFGLSAAAVAALVAAMRPGEAAFRTQRAVAAVLFIIAAACGVLVARFSIDSIDAQYMRFWWSLGFMPMPPTTGDVLWLWRRVASVFSLTSHYRAAIAWVCLMVAGAWSLTRRQRAASALLLAAPLGFAAAASVPRLYPFVWGRTQFFLLPVVLMLVAEGAAWCLQLRGTAFRQLRTVPIGVIIVLAAYSTIRRSGRMIDADIKPHLQQVKTEWHPGDRLWVHYKLGQQFLYYAPRYGFTANDFVIARCSIGSARGYLRELAALHRDTTRAWLLMADADGRDIEAAVILGYVRSLGAVEAANTTHRHEVPEGGRIGLLEWRPPDAGTTAEQFTILPEIDHPEPFPWMCHGVFQPLHLRPLR